MSDNKSIRDKRDSSKIDSTDPSEIEYVHKQFPTLEHAQVLEGIKSKGPEREAVMSYLEALVGKH